MNTTRNRKKLKISRNPPRLIYFLLEKLDEGHPQISWVDKEKKIFLVQKIHGLRSDFQEAPNDLFRSWSMYRRLSYNNPTMNKVRIKAGLSKCKDISFIKELSSKKNGTNDAYQLKPGSESWRIYEAACGLINLQTSNIKNKLYSDHNRFSGILALLYTHQDGPVPNIVRRRASSIGFASQEDDGLFHFC